MKQDPMERYIDIKKQIADTRKRRDDLMRVGTVSLLEEIKGRAEGKNLEDVSSHYIATVKVLDLQLADLEAQLPCEALIARYGLECHEAYKAQYPINAQTKLVQAPRDWVVSGRVNYVLPRDPVFILDVLNGDPSPLAFSTTVKTATFRAWQYPPAGRFYLAFAPEINTVYHS